jgi:hypothetical protein
MGEANPDVAYVLRRTEDPYYTTIIISGPDLEVKVDLSPDNVDSSNDKAPHSRGQTTIGKIVHDVALWVYDDGTRQIEHRTFDVKPTPLRGVPVFE